MGPPLLAAVLIVRDEAASLPGCLESLRGVADEVHVLDTGSVDDTAAIAERYGAAVTYGTWPDDFASARNTAAVRTSATWILAVDADHRVTADPVALPAVLRRTEAEAILVEVDDQHHAHPYRQAETRLYRSDALTWDGRVHERLVRPDGSAPSTAEIPAEMLQLTHLGYATHADRLRRAERHLDLGRRALGDFAGLGPDAERSTIAHTMLALGNDYAAAEHWQDAVDTFEAVRELFPGTPEWLAATDGLARVLLAFGYDKAGLVLVGQLRAGGAPEAFCDWLAAQAYAQLGDPRTAARLLAGVAEVVDTTGRRYAPAALGSLRTMVNRLAALTSTG